MLVTRLALAASTQKPVMHHRQRFEDSRAQEDIELLPRQLLDEIALNVDAGSVAPVSAGLRGQRQL